MNLTNESPFRFDLQLFAEGENAGGGSGDGNSGGAQGGEGSGGSDTAKTTTEPKTNAGDPVPVDESKLDDHAKNVLADYRKELKRHREDAEKAQRAADAAKKAADDAIAAANDAKKKLTAKEEAELAEQKKWQELAEKRAEEKRAAEEASEKKLSDMEANHRSQLEAYNNGLVLEAVARAAEREGILDPEDIELPAFAEALKLATVKNGRVAGAKEAVEKMREIKPGKFKAADDGQSGGGGNQGAQNQGGGDRNAGGQFTRATPARNATTQKDAAKLNDSDFSELEARLRRGVA